MKRSVGFIAFCLCAFLALTSGCSATLKASKPVELFSAEDIAESRNLRSSTDVVDDGNINTSHGQMRDLDLVDVSGMSLPIRRWSAWHQTVEHNSPSGLLSPGLKRVDGYFLNEVTGEITYLGASDADSGSVLESIAMPAGIVGGAALLRPARTNVTQEGGGASANSGSTAAGGQGGNSSSNSNSSSDSTSGSSSSSKSGG